MYNFCLMSVIFFPSELCITKQVDFPTVNNKTSFHVSVWMSREDKVHLVRFTYASLETYILHVLALIILSRQTVFSVSLFGNQVAYLDAIFSRYEYSSSVMLRIFHLLGKFCSHAMHQ